MKLYYPFGSGLGQIRWCDAADPRPPRPSHGLFGGWYFTPPPLPHINPSEINRELRETAICRRPTNQKKP